MSPRRAAIGIRRGGGMHRSRRRLGGGPGLTGPGNAGGRMPEINGNWLLQLHAAQEPPLVSRRGAICPNTADVAIRGATLADHVPGSWRIVEPGLLRFASTSPEASTGGSALDLTSHAVRTAQPCPTGRCLSEQYGRPAPSRRALHFPQIDGATRSQNPPQEGGVSMFRLNSVSAWHSSRQIRASSPPYGPGLTVGLAVGAPGTGLSTLCWSQSPQSRLTWVGD